MYTRIDKKIKVIALFESGKIIPKIFRYSNRDYKIKEISMVYTESSGSSINHYFAVMTDDGGVFKLFFNDKSLVWILEEVWSE